MRDGHAGELLHGLHGPGRAPIGVRGVDLGAPVTGQIHHRVARNGHHGQLAFFGIHAQEDHHVRARRLVALACIGTQKQHVEGLFLGFRRRRGKRGAKLALFLLVVERQGLVERVEIEGGGASGQPQHARKRYQHDEHGLLAPARLLAHADDVFGLRQIRSRTQAIGLSGSGRASCLRLRCRKPAAVTRLSAKRHGGPKARSVVCGSVVRRDGRTVPRRATGSVSAARCAVTVAREASRSLFEGHLHSEPPPPHAFSGSRDERPMPSERLLCHVADHMNMPQSP